MSLSSRPGSFAGAASFLVGIPLGIAFLWAVRAGPWQHVPWKRYLEHPVEMAEVILFAGALTALAGKILSCWRQRLALRQEALPGWNGQAVPTTDARALREHLAQQPSHLQSSWLGRRIAGVLEFVQSRGSVNQLDDHLRTLSDNDAATQDGSYSLLRFVTWAIPILGFLGTVLGITDAVAGVTPETLEQSLNDVTSGLATAFDTTALALLLTMVLMFFTFLCERFDQALLQQVDAYVDAELAHRFERTGPETSPIIEALRHTSQSLVKTNEQLIQKQAALWTQTLEKMEQRWHEAAPQQLALVQRALEQAFDATLARHAEQMSRLENRFLMQSQAMLESVTATADKLHLQTQALLRLQENEAQLVRLQETLNNNLAAVANTSAFDQAVQSLTAAIHLLTTRVGPVPTAPPPRVTKPAA
jgi:biopolymer transport protein ExbB/TolQ